MTVVYHVGNLNKPRRRPASSLEGNGLSVSQYPNTWARIARLGHTVWELKKNRASFFSATMANLKRAVRWALREGWLKEKTRFRVSWYDDEMESEMFTYFDNAKEAEAEAEATNSTVEAVNAVVFAPKGLAYWRASFTSKPDNNLAEDFSVLWYAEAHGYDGVWWGEELDEHRYSAPRGVIFQSRLSSWKKRLLPPTEARDLE